MNIERRSFGLEIRGDGSRLIGHASVFDLPSEEMHSPWHGSFREMIAPGAFDGALERVHSGKDHVASIWNHNPDFVIASTRDGSLKLSVDSRGLVADITPIDTQTIRDLVVKPILDGKVRDMSFGFTVAEGGEHEETRDGQPFRIIDRVERLYDASPVLFGAYPQTDIAARSLLSVLQVDADKLSSLERAAVESFLSSIARHLPVVSAQEGSTPADTTPLAGVSAKVRSRLLELQDRDFALSLIERK